MLVLDQPVSTPTPTDAPTADADPTATPTDRRPRPMRRRPPRPTRRRPTDAPTPRRQHAGADERPDRQRPEGPSVGILVSRAELAALPTSGTAWSNLKSWADAAAGTPDIQNQNEDNDIHVLAKALVYARTGIAATAPAS